MGVRRLAAAAAAALALTACSAGTPAPPTSTQPRIAPSWPVGIDSSAVGLALASGGVVVTTPGYTKFPPQIYRFGPDGGRQAMQSVAGNPNGLVVGPDGSLWVPAVTHPDMQTGTGMQVLDPVSLHLRREVRLPATPFAVAFRGGEAWVGTATGLEVLTERRATPVRSIRLGAPVYAVVVEPTGRYVLAVLEDGLTVVDGRTGTALARRKLGNNGSIAATVAGGAVWIGYPAAGAGKLERLALPSLAPARTGPALTELGVSLAGTAARLWVADHGGHLLCVDPATGAVHSDREVHNQAAVAADQSAVYVGDVQKVTRVAATC
jgi:outer membrane protein assembly factor BamB